MDYETSHEQTRMTRIEKDQMNLSHVVSSLERVHALSHEHIEPRTEKELVWGRTANLIKRTALATYETDAITLFDGDLRAVGFHKDHRLVLSHSPVLRPYGELKPGEINPFVPGVFVRRLEDHQLVNAELFSEPTCVHGPDYGRAEPAKHITEVCMHNGYATPHSILELNLQRKTLRFEHHDERAKTEYVFALGEDWQIKNVLAPGTVKSVLSIETPVSDDHVFVRGAAGIVLDRAFDLLDRIVGESKHEKLLMKGDGLHAHGTRVVLYPRAYEIRKGDSDYRLHRISNDVPRLRFGRVNIHLGNDLSSIPLSINDDGTFTLPEEQRTILDAVGKVYELAGEEERDVMKLTISAISAADYEHHRQDLRVKQMSGALTDLLAKMHRSSPRSGGARA